MNTSLAWLAAAVRSGALRAAPTAAAPNPNRPRARSARRLAGDRGEGVISVAIAVLIMAFLGALMWVGFNTMWTKTESKTNDRVDQIGADQ